MTRRYDVGCALLMPNSASMPFHMICTPMHSRMKADSRMNTASPLGPSARDSRSANAKQKKVVMHTIDAPTTAEIASVRKGRDGRREICANGHCYGYRSGSDGQRQREGIEGLGFHGALAVNRRRCGATFATVVQEPEAEARDDQSARELQDGDRDPEEVEDEIAREDRGDQQHEPVDRHLARERSALGRRQVGGHGKEDRGVAQRIDDGDERCHDEQHALHDAAHFFGHGVFAGT